MRLRGRRRAFRTCRRERAPQRDDGGAPGFAGWWREIPIGRRILIAVFGGSGALIALGLVKIAIPAWLQLAAMACAVGAVIYAYTRRCPSYAAGGVVSMTAIPRRHCEQCGKGLL
jgi:hypothetical protein